MTSTRVLRGNSGLMRPPHRPVVTVGVFDGVHVAHQQLIRSTVQVARRMQTTSLIITFDPDPQEILNPRHFAPALMPLEERVRCLRLLGVDAIWIIPFTRRFSRMTAKQFLRHVLIERLRARALLVGETFLFGRQRHGNIALLQALGPALGMRVIAVRSIHRQGGPVSSSRIRQLIAVGKLADATRLLGRPPALYGTVVHGVGRGRFLGFPTANIRLAPQVLPPTGVYAVLVQTTSGAQRWHGVMNLGVRPTFGPGPLVCEVHLLNFSGTLHGCAVSVHLMTRLRGERCFSSPRALVQQIRHDLHRTRVALRRSA